MFYSKFKSLAIVTQLFFILNLKRDDFYFGKSVINMFEFGGNPILIWLPVVEPDLGQERFLSDDPTRLFWLGQFARVPVMAGITELEFAYLGIGEIYIWW